LRQLFNAYFKQDVIKFYVILLITFIVNTELMKFHT